MDPITALTAIGTVLKIVDGIESQIDRFIHKKPETSSGHPPRALAKQETAEKIVVEEAGRVVETVTVQDIQKLDDNSLRLIKALERSMQRDFDLWTSVYPQRGISPDPLRNAQVEAQLNDIAKRMGNDLEKISGYLDRIGKHLPDHYSHIRSILDNIGNA